MELINGDCLIELQKIADKSVDFVYLDLPYGQTACKWDIKLDLEKLWKQLKRIAKNDRTPFFFSCTTKFGYELIGANPKWFRWDLVWEKNRAAGFLNAYKLPMRKHEMIYCFAKKTPEYDVSSHSEYTEDNSIGKTYGNLEVYGKNKNMMRPVNNKRHKDPLPTSVLPPTDDHELIYCFAKKTPEYDVSSHSEFETGKSERSIDCETYGKDRTNKYNPKTHKDRLPTSVLPPTDDHELIYCFAKKTPEYDVSSHSESKTGGDLIGEIDNSKMIENRKKTTFRTNTKHKDPLPTSVLPSSWCKFSLDNRTGHRTAKPVKLMEFLLKYWSKPGDTVLDPTAGSGSMGIACKNMNRKFIGIEKDEAIFELAKKRLSVKD